MKRIVPILGLAVLLLATIQVYVVRDRILDAEIPPEKLQALKERLNRFPRELGGGRYTSVEYEIDPGVVEESGADAYVARGYRDENGAIYRVYIGGAIRNRESFHAPNYCMPAGGWELQQQRTVDSPMGDEGARVRLLVAEKAGARMLVYYWFQSGRRQTDHDLVARWYRFLDFVSSSLGFTDADSIPPTMIATVYVPFTETPEAAEQRARVFMKNVRPALMGAVAPRAE